MNKYYKKRLIQILAFIILPFSLSACSHQLEIKNEHLYSCATKICNIEKKPIVAILPFSGSQDDLFYFNAIVNRLSMAPNIKEFYTDYNPSREGSSENRPDFILSVRPSVKYESSGWNFPINWPGFLIFTPAWNGYVYSADIMTFIDIQDKNGNVVNQIEIPMSYDIRQAEMDRTVFTGLTWLEVSVLAFGGGIYNANVFDRDIIGAFQLQVKDNYTNYVMNELLSKVNASSRQL